VDQLFDVMHPDCPSRVILQRMGDKWTPLVFQALKNGPLRFGDLRTTIGTVTPKVLTQTLRTLERDGFVTRSVYAQMPPRVEYSLTDLGRSALEPLDAVRDWAERHAGAVISRREEFDSAQA
jgi:DNA-binding HxlR family transcriptional regulator